MTLAAKEIVCVPVRYPNGELVYEPLNECRTRSVSEGFIDWTDTRRRPVIVVVADVGFEPVVSAKTDRQEWAAAADELSREAREAADRLINGYYLRFHMGRY